MDRNLLCWTRRGKRMSALNGVAKTGEKGLAGGASGHVAFQFLAQRVIQIAIQILGKVGKYLLAFTGARHCGGCWVILSAPRAGRGQFLANK